jgi:hypothetical protein
MVNEYDWPVESGLDVNASGEPVSETMACGGLSWFVHVTTMPAFTVSAGGSNAKFFIVIAVPLPADGCGDADAAGAAGVWPDEQPATMQAAIRSMIPATRNTRCWPSFLFSGFCIFFPP